MQQVEFNGELVAADTAAVATTDLGLLFGIGLFETMQAYHGTVFRFEAHLQRLRDSAAALGLPASEACLPDAAACQRLLEANTLSEARLRLTMTGGVPATAGMPRPTVLMTAVPAERYPSAYYEQGVTVLVGHRLQVSTDAMAMHKTTSYWPRLQLLHQAQMSGCAEALWFTENRQLAEGCISNIFIIKNGVVRTPPLETPVLPGITRAEVLRLCTERGIECRAEPLVIDDVLDADEMFMTNSMMELIPVVRVERKAIAEEKVGPITVALSEHYQQAVIEACGSHPEHE